MLTTSGLGQRQSNPLIDDNFCSPKTIANSTETVSVVYMTLDEEEALKSKVAGLIDKRNGANKSAEEAEAREKEAEAREMIAREKAKEHHERAAQLQKEMDEHQIKADVHGANAADAHERAVSAHDKAEI